MSQPPSTVHLDHYFEQLLLDLARCASVRRIFTQGLPGERTDTPSHDDSARYGAPALERQRRTNHIRRTAQGRRPGPDRRPLRWRSLLGLRDH